MSLFFDERIRAYLWWFYGLPHLDQIGLRSTTVIHDSYIAYIHSGDPKIRYQTWGLIAGTCQYLAQKGISNDGLN